MLVYVRTSYNRMTRALVLSESSSEPKEEVKIYGDPSKALIFLMLCGKKIGNPPPGRSGFTVELSDDEWAVVKALAKVTANNRITWKFVARWQLLENPTAENIRRALSIEKLVR